MLPILIPIKNFALKHKKPLLIAVLAIVVLAVLHTGISKVIDRINDRRLGKLELQLQSSETKVQVLEGQIQVLNGQLTSVQGELVESNKRLGIAESTAEQSRIVYVTSKTKGPAFVSKTDEGQVNELTDVMNKLYP